MLFCFNASDCIRSNPLLCSRETQLLLCRRLHIHLLRRYAQDPGQILIHRRNERCELRLLRYDGRINIANPPAFCREQLRYMLQQQQTEIPS